MSCVLKTTQEGYSGSSFPFPHPALPVYTPHADHDEANHEGKVIHMNTDKIILSGHRDTLTSPLITYQRFNINTCIHQKPWIPQDKCIKKGQILVNVWSSFR
uniref:Uncharacterized protein n=1 Tax=Opuntia streptacantha TaxID=393608 RepID=A0A7C9CAV5_OPUST